MNTVRVFPRRTKATPDDAMAYVGGPDMFVEADRVEISVAFTWDIPTAERLAQRWRRVAPVFVGGPAYNEPGGDFIPGRYLKPGYVVTSRGCPNRCWFCSVWRRERGVVRELPITDGWNVLDDNLLACSESHIRSVFAMLHRQRERVCFTGGLEAARLTDWHVDLLASLKPRPDLFFAYDTPDDEEPLRIAAKKVFSAGFSPTSHHVRCYVLIGYPKDTFQLAEKRLSSVVSMGLTPMAMLWRDDKGETTIEWRRLQRSWARPAVIYAKK